MIYRGVVSNTDDPLKKSRIQIDIDDYFSKKREDDWKDGISEKVRMWVPINIPLGVSSVSVSLEVGDVVTVGFFEGDSSDGIILGKINNIADENYGENRQSLKVDDIVLMIKDNKISLKNSIHDFFILLEETFNIIKTHKTITMLGTQVPTPDDIIIIEALFLKYKQLFAEGE